MRKALLIPAALCSLLIATTASAAVVADGTLGSVVTHGGNNYAITAGTQKGNNLFHSLSQFNLTSTEIATFGGSAGIANIISRITGGTPSRVDGTIRSTISGANLYLLNPAGIMFGPSASLDVTGSFHATTADYLQFGQDRFYADPLLPVPVSITAPNPTAFGFLKPNPAAITVNGSLLAVPQGKSVSLVAGGIEIADANLWASGGAINLVSVASPGEVLYDGTNITPQGFSALGPINISEKRNPSLWPLYGKVATSWNPDNQLLGFSMANLDTSGLASGRILIRGGSFYMSGISDSVRATIFNDSYGNAAIPQGLTDIAATGDVNLFRSTLTGNSYWTAPGAAISISATALNVIGSTINTDSSNNMDNQNGSNGTDILLKAANSILISNGSKVSTDGDSIGAFAGNIVLISPNVSILNKDTMVSTSANVFGAAGAGSITVFADNNLTITGKLESKTSSGKSGVITIRTGALSILDNGKISTSLLYNNKSADPNAQQSAGDVYITANSIHLNGDGRIESSVLNSASGNGGNITIDAANLSLLDRSSISASIDSLNGSGGNITVRALENILVSSNPIGLVKEIGSIASDTTSGNAGHISLTAPNITVNNGATVSTYGTPGSTGSAGNISLAANNLLSVDSGFINTQSASSSGGNIFITAPNIMKVTNGEVTASATAGAGNGGNVTIDAGYLTLNNSVITAQAEFGNGGNLLINVSKMFIKSADSVLSASSRYGQQGTVVVNAPNTDVAGALAAPMYDILNLNTFIPKRCMAADELNASTFRLLGSFGLPATPENSFPIL